MIRNGKISLLVTDRAGNFEISCISVYFNVSKDIHRFSINIELWMNEWMNDDSEVVSKQVNSKFILKWVV